MLRTRCLLARTGPLQRYGDLILSKAKESNPAQLAAVGALQRLHESLLKPSDSSALVQPPPRSLYLHGGVGVGKTFLMDLLHASLVDGVSGGDSSVVSKRVHFHAFLRDLHSSLHKVRSSSSSSAVDYSVLLRRVLDDLLSVPNQRSTSTTVLCFDEFHIADIADGMLLHRIFDKLLSTPERRFVLVVTSNREPSTLYENGINRQLIIPFIHLIQEKFDVVRLEAGQDYRATMASSFDLPSSPASEGLEKVAEADFPSFSSPASSVEARERFQKHFRALASSRHAASSSFVPPGSPPVLVSSHEIPVASFNRFVTVPLSYPSANVAYYKYDELCLSNLSYVDYLALAGSFDVLFVEGVPPFDTTKREEGRRFINVVDCFYDAGKELIILGSESGTSVKSLSRPSVDSFPSSSPPPPSSLFADDASMRVAGEGGSSGRSTTMVGETEWSATGLHGRALADATSGGRSDVQFSSDRTISRLLEMGGVDYRRKNKERGDANNSRT